MFAGFLEGEQFTREVFEDVKNPGMMGGAMVFYTSNSDVMTGCS